MAWNNRPRRGKYNATKAEADGIKFDSKRERDYYLKLKALQEAGEISELQLQVKIEIQPHFKHNGKMIRAINYYADFTYKDKNDIIHIVDTKGFKTPEYQLKKKLLLFRGIEIEEV